MLTPECSKLPRLPNAIIERTSIRILASKLHFSSAAAASGCSSSGGALAPGPASAWLALTSLESSAQAPLSLDPGAASDGFRRAHCSLAGVVLANSVPQTDLDAARPGQS